MTDVQLNDVLHAAAEAAAYAAQQVLEAHNVKLSGVLVVAELSSPDPTGIVHMGSWLHISDQSSLLVVAETLRRVVEKLPQQAPAPPKTKREVN